MKKILYSDLNALGNIVDSVLQNPKLKDGMKKATLFKFWPKTVGKKFENVSEIVSLNSTNGKTLLTIACASAAVTGELMMYKNQLLKKLNSYANPLAIQIDDINFSHKIWKSETNQIVYDVKLQEDNPYKEDLTGFDPDSITIDEDELSSIKENILSNKALSPQQQERLLNSIINDLKAQKFKSENL